MHANSEPLKLGSISELAEGQAEAVINSAIDAAVRDTEDRGDDEKPRKVTIELVFMKLNENQIAATVKAKTTLPPYATKPTIGNLVSDGRRAEMQFSTASQGNPDQPGLPGAHD